jgi:acyl-CoA synthetase (NDP forming)
MIAPGALRPDVQTRYAEAGIPVFSDVATGMDSLKAIYEANDFAVAPSVGQSAGAPQPLAPDLAAQARALLSAAAHRDFLTEIESAGVLRLAGVPMVETRRVGSLAEADRAAEHFGYPLVMKAIAPGIAHKNEAGLVIVGIADATGLAAAFAALVEKTAIRQGTGPGAEIIVQPLVPARAELIVGTTFEPGLGHFLLAGLGGIDAELYDTFELIPVPTPKEEIARRLGAARVAPHLDRLARRTVPDLATRIAGVLDGLQALVLAVPDAIQSIDVNPLLVGPSGLTAVDALIVPRRA